MGPSFESLPLSIRLNPFKPCDLSGLPLDTPVPWCPQGRYLLQRPSFTLDPLFHAGAYYVQDASAMFVGYALRSSAGIFPGVRVLDLCAAPGGKTTDVAASLRLSLGSRWTLVSNEVIRSRASVLADNVSRWGDPNVCVTSSDPACFGRLGPLFDIIVADVPCSGEGMFRKSADAREMFSEDNVALCASRSRRIVSDAWPSLKPGGVLVYSTCTYPEAENDGNVEWICRTLGGSAISFDSPVEGPEKTAFGYLLRAGKVRGDGQYCALIRKDSDEPIQEHSFDSESVRTWEDRMEFFDRGGEIFALGAEMSALMDVMGGKVSVLQCGTHAFTMKGRDRVPHADLALSLILEDEDFPCVEVDRAAALSFLHKDSLRLEGQPRGYLIIKYGGLPLGFVNNIGSRANNMLPASRRILMDVNI